MVSLWELMVVAQEAKELAKDHDVVSIHAGPLQTYVQIRDELFTKFFPFAVDVEELTNSDGQKCIHRSIKLDGITFDSYKEVFDGEDQ